MNQKERDKKEAIAALREILKPGDTVYTVLRHVSRSGMYRAIDCYIIEDDQPRWISRLVARASGHGFDERHEAVKATGCGMDMGLEVVYNLSHSLFPDGFGCIGASRYCPSNDHSNGDRDYTRSVQIYSDEAIARDHLSCPVAFSHWHKSGGYALRHRWM